MSDHISESILLALPKLTDTDPEAPPAPLQELCRVVSDDRTGEVHIVFGGARLIISAWNAAGLAKDIQRHANRVKQGLMVNDRVEDIG